MVEAHTSEIEPESYVMTSLGPVRVRHILKLRIVAIVRHERVHAAERCKTRDGECRQAAFKTPCAVRTRNPVYVAAEILVQARLLGICIHERVSEIGIDDECWAKQVCGRNRRAPGAAIAVSRVAAAGDARAADFRTEHFLIQRIEFQPAHASVRGELVVDVVIDLRIQGVAIEKITRSAEEIVRQDGPRLIGLGQLREQRR